jgi:CRP/FNR family cyclic AMP-dependent transcriptional regulator
VIPSSTSLVARDLQDLLASFPSAVAEEFAQIAVVRRWCDGDVVYRGGAVVPSVALLLEGRLRLAATSQEGDEVLFRWFIRGEFIGMASALGDLPFAVDALAVGDCCTAHFERAQFLRILRSNAEAALTAARQISQSAFDMTQLVIARSEPTLTARVYAVLLRLARHNATIRSSGEVALAVSQNDLALAVSASRARVNIELHKLATMGRLRLGYKHIIMLDLVRAPGECRAECADPDQPVSSASRNVRHRSP